MIIEVEESNKNKICKNILTQLPGWFALPDAIEDYSNGVMDSTMFSLKEGNQTIGFISLKKHYPYSYEVYVMGLLSEYHNKGLGSKLLAHAEEYLLAQGAKILTVKTLSESRPDKYYDLTRKFYLKNGFIPVEEFKELWGEDNPSLLMVKIIPSSVR